MGFELDMILENIRLQRDMYVRELQGLSEDDNEERIRQGAYIKCLDKLSRDLMYPSVLRKKHVLSDFFERNFDDGFDVKIIFNDDSSMIVRYDDWVVDVKDGFLVLYDKKEYESDTTIIPSKVRLISLDSVKEVFRLEDYMKML